MEEAGAAARISYYAGRLSLLSADKDFDLEILLALKSDLDKAFDELTEIQ